DSLHGHSGTSSFRRDDFGTSLAIDAHSDGSARLLCGSPNGVGVFTRGAGADGVWAEVSSPFNSAAEVVGVAVYGDWMTAVGPKGGRTKLAGGYRADFYGDVSAVALGEVDGKMTAVYVAKEYGNYVALTWQQWPDGWEFHSRVYYGRSYSALLLPHDHMLFGDTLRLHSPNTLTEEGDPIAGTGSWVEVAEIDTGCYSRREWAYSPSVAADTFLVVGDPYAEEAVQYQGVVAVREISAPGVGGVTAVIEATPGEVCGETSVTVSLSDTASGAYGGDVLSALLGLVVTVNGASFHAPTPTGETGVYSVSLPLPSTPGPHSISATINGAQVGSTSLSLSRTVDVALSSLHLPLEVAVDTPFSAKVVPRDHCGAMLTGLSLTLSTEADGVISTLSDASGYTVSGLTVPSPQSLCYTATVVGSPSDTWSNCVSGVSGVVSELPTEPYLDADVNGEWLAFAYSGRDVSLFHMLDGHWVPHSTLPETVHLSFAKDIYLFTHSQETLSEYRYDAEGDVWTLMSTGPLRGDNFATNGDSAVGFYNYDADDHSSWGQYGHALDRYYSVRFDHPETSISGIDSYNRIYGAAAGAGWFVLTARNSSTSSSTSSDRQAVVQLYEDGQVWRDEPYVYYNDHTDSLGDGIALSPDSLYVAYSNTVSRDQGRVILRKRAACGFGGEDWCWGYDGTVYSPSKMPFARFGERVVMGQGVAVVTSLENRAYVFSEPVLGKVWEYITRLDDVGSVETDGVSLLISSPSVSPAGTRVIPLVAEVPDGIVGTLDTSLLTYAGECAEVTVSVVDAEGDAYTPDIATPIYGLRAVWSSADNDDMEWYGAEITSDPGVYQMRVCAPDEAEVAHTLHVYIGATLLVSADVTPSDTPDSALSEIYVHPTQSVGVPIWIHVVNHARTYPRLSVYNADGERVGECTTASTGRDYSLTLGEEGTYTASLYRSYCDPNECSAYTVVSFTVSASVPLHSVPIPSEYPQSIVAYGASDDSDWLIVGVSDVASDTSASAVLAFQRLTNTYYQFHSAFDVEGVTNIVLHEETVALGVSERVVGGVAGAGAVYVHRLDTDSDTWPLLAVVVAADEDHQPVAPGLGTIIGVHDDTLLVGGTSCLIYRADLSMASDVYGSIILTEDDQLYLKPPYSSRKPLSAVSIDASGGALALGLSADKRALLMDTTNGDTWWDEYSQELFRSASHTGGSHVAVNGDRHLVFWTYETEAFWADYEYADDTSYDIGSYYLAAASYTPGANVTYTRDVALETILAGPVRQVQSEGDMLAVIYESGTLDVFTIQEDGEGGLVLSDPFPLSEVVGSCSHVTALEDTLYVLADGVLSALPYSALPTDSEVTASLTQPDVSGGTCSSSDVTFRLSLDGSPYGEVVDVSRLGVSVGDQLFPAVYTGGSTYTATVQYPSAGITYDLEVKRGESVIASSTVTLEAGVVSATMSRVLVPDVTSVAGFSFVTQPSNACGTLLQGPDVSVTIEQSGTTLQTLSATSASGYSVHSGALEAGLCTIRAECGGVSWGVEVTVEEDTAVGTPLARADSTHYRIVSSAADGEWLVVSYEQPHNDSWKTDRTVSVYRCPEGSASCVWHSSLTSPCPYHSVFGEYIALSGDWIVTTLYQNPSVIYNRDMREMRMAAYKYNAVSDQYELLDRPFLRSPTTDALSPLVALSEADDGDSPTLFLSYNQVVYEFAIDTNNEWQFLSGVVGEYTSTDAYTMAIGGPSVALASIGEGSLVVSYGDVQQTMECPDRAEEATFGTSVALSPSGLLLAVSNADRVHVYSLASDAFSYVHSLLLPEGYEVSDYQALAFGSETQLAIDVNTCIFTAFLGSDQWYLSHTPTSLPSCVGGCEVGSGHDMFGHNGQTIISMQRIDGGRGAVYGLPFVTPLVLPTLTATLVEVSEVAECVPFTVEFTLYLEDGSQYRDDVSPSLSATLGSDVFHPYYRTSSGDYAVDLTVSASATTPTVSTLLVSLQGASVATTDISVVSQVAPCALESQYLYDYSTWIELAPIHDTCGRDYTAEATSVVVRDLSGETVMQSSPSSSLRKSLDDYLLQGEYTVTVTVDGTVQAGLPLYVYRTAVPGLNGNPDVYCSASSVTLTWAAPSFPAGGAVSASLVLTDMATGVVVDWDADVKWRLNTDYVWSSATRDGAAFSLGGLTAPSVLNSGRFVQVWVSGGHLLSEVIPVGIEVDLVAGGRVVLTGVDMDPITESSSCGDTPVSLSLQGVTVDTPLAAEVDVCVEYVGGDGCADLSLEDGRYYGVLRSPDVPGSYVLRVSASGLTLISDSTVDVEQSMSSFTIISQDSTFSEKRERAYFTVEPRDGCNNPMASEGTVIVRDSDGTAYRCSTESGYTDDAWAWSFYPYDESVYTIEVYPGSTGSTDPIAEAVHYVGWTVTVDDSTSYNVGPGSGIIGLPERGPDGLQVMLEHGSQVTCSVVLYECSGAPLVLPDVSVYWGHLKEEEIQLSYDEETETYPVEIPVWSIADAYYGDGLNVAISGVQLFRSSESYFAGVEVAGSRIARIRADSMIISAPDNNFDFALYDTSGDMVYSADVAEECVGGWGSDLSLPASLSDNGSQYTISVPRPSEVGTFTFNLALGGVVVYSRDYEVIAPYDPASSRLLLRDTGYVRDHAVAGEPFDVSVQLVDANGGYASAETVSMVVSDPEGNSVSVVSTVASGSSGYYEGEVTVPSAGEYTISAEVAGSTQPPISDSPLTVYAGDFGLDIGHYGTMWMAVLESGSSLVAPTAALPGTDTDPSRLYTAAVSFVDAEGLYPDSSMRRATVSVDFFSVDAVGDMEDVVASLSCDYDQSGDGVLTFTGYAPQDMAQYTLAVSVGDAAPLFTQGVAVSVPLTVGGVDVAVAGVSCEEGDDPLEITLTQASSSQTVTFVVDAFSPDFTDSTPFSTGSKETVPCEVDLSDHICGTWNGSGCQHPEYQGVGVYMMEVTAPNVSSERTLLFEISCDDEPLFSQSVQVAPTPTDPESSLPIMPIAVGAVGVVGVSVGLCVCCSGDDEDSVKEEEEDKSQQKQEEGVHVPFPQPVPVGLIPIQLVPVEQMPVPGLVYPPSDLSNLSHLSGPAPVALDPGLGDAGDTGTDTGTEGCPSEAETEASQVTLYCSDVEGSETDTVSE
ncbi:hypothetical protein KIPB_002828, partial [Kipferlia bialata]